MPTTLFVARERRLKPEEMKRNQIGTSQIFAYTHDQETVYPSSLPGFFPPISHCQCKMVPFNLPTLDGLHLVKGLCDGVQLGIHAMPGFPTLQTLSHTAQVLHHSVNVFQADSRNQSVVLFIQNAWEGKKSAGIAEQLIGTKIFGNWPFLVEGMVVAVSDSHFKYEKTLIGDVEKVISNPHTSNPRDGGMGGWTRRAERIESWYSKRFGVVTGDVDVLVHIRPLKGVLVLFASYSTSRLTLPEGLKRLDSGALVKDYEGQEKETETAVQLSLLEVSSEDPRYQEQIPPPISEEFPEGTKVFFLGEHAYGTAAQVSSTLLSSMAVVLAVRDSPSLDSI
jgi:5'-3' exoribonuclease 1